MSFNFDWDSLQCSSKTVIKKAEVLGCKKANLQFNPSGRTRDQVLRARKMCSLAWGGCGKLKYTTQFLTASKVCKVCAKTKGEFLQTFKKGNCKLCGSEFKRTSPAVAYCSQDCNDNARRGRERARYVRKKALT